ncbi:MAG: helix-turn-helix transcriptional regulator [Ilumatobacteraceae bacterium]
MSTHRNIETVVTGTAHLGNTIRRAREQQGLDQAELAERADVHRTYVSKFENNPPRDTLSRLIRMLQALDLELVVRQRTPR